MQNAVRSLRILTNIRCFADTDILAIASTQTVHSQELLIAAPLRIGVNLIILLFIKRCDK